MNNRQGGGGRRRGRSGQAPRGMSGNAGGNSRDNRQRGNAAQLLEKYKSLARDSQLAGDRVQTEYYLQFADHYFRVLGETRSRFEDQRPRRDDDEEGDELDDENMEMDGDGDNEEPRQDRFRDRGDRDRSERDRPDRERADRDRPDRDRPARDGGNRQPRADRYARDDRPVRQDRDDRPVRPEQVERAERPERSESDDSERRERFAREDRPDRPERRPRRERVIGRDRGEAAQGEEEPQGLPQHILPPAIGISADDSSETVQEEAPAPRRRTRRVRPLEDEGEIAPAA